METKKTNEFIAFYKSSHQITEDAWIEDNLMLKLTDMTTIGEIEEWFHNKHKTRLMDVKIVQVSEPTKTSKKTNGKE